jgi:hypothetical protein
MFYNTIKIMNMKKLIFTILIASCLMMTKTSNSQITGNIKAMGTVLVPIAITSTSDLDFGKSILPGISVRVDKRDASAGQFSLEGQPNQEISISLKLPTTLTSGINDMPISFSTVDAGYKTPAGKLTNFNPDKSTTASFAKEGSMVIYLGGRLNPSHTQAAGEYTAQIQLSVFYTGN